MISVNNNLLNVNLLDTMGFMVNSSHTALTPTIESKIVSMFDCPVNIWTDSSFSSTEAYLNGVNSDGTTERVVRLRHRFDRNNGGTSMRSYLELYDKDDNFVYGHANSGSWAGVSEFNVSIYGGDIIIQGVNLPFEKDYEYYSFETSTPQLFSIGEGKDVSLYEDSQNWFITDSHGLSLLNKVNQELYNENNDLLDTFTTYSEFKNNLESVKSIITTTTDEDSSKFIRLLNPSIRYSKYNNIVTVYNKLPITLEESLITDVSKDYYLVNIARNFNEDSCINVFGDKSQITYTWYSLGDESDTSTADIKLDYINRVDMIDSIKLNIKVSNIIN